MATPGDTTRCPNCGAEGAAAYCPECGQRQRDPRRSIFVLAGELLEEMALTGRLPTTVRTLLTKPGKLTADWIEGHRAEYLSPVRLYIVASVVFFTVAFLLGLPFDDQLPELPSFSADPESPLALARDATSGRLQTLLTLGVLALVPIVAVLLRILHLRRRFIMVDHLVFSLHLHAFTLLVLTVAYVPASFVTGEWSWLETVISTVAFALLLSPGVYIALALRRVYGDRGWRRIWRFMAVGSAWGVGVIGMLMYTLTDSFELDDQTRGARYRYMAGIYYNQMADAREDADTAAVRALGRYALGMFDLTDSVVLTPHDHYHIAELQLLKHDTAAARASLGRYLRAEPHDPLALGFAAHLARAQGDDDIADRLFRRLLATGTDSVPGRHGEDFARFLEEARRGR
jgi:hypothetical protein